MDDERNQLKHRVTAQFNDVADGYDVTGPGHFAYFGERLVAVACIREGERVLDVATGRGAALFPALARVGSTGSAVGIDLSEKMLQALQLEANRQRIAIDVRVMDAESLEFPDASFDHVLCAFGVMFFPNKSSALAEFRRVLKPNGGVALSTWSFSPAADLMNSVFEFGFEQGAKLTLTDPTELGTLLSDAGFVDVSVTSETRQFAFAALDAYWENARSTGVRAVIDRLGVAEADQVRAKLAARLAAYQAGSSYLVPATALLATARR